MNQSTRDKGRHAEEIACKFLCRHGMRLLQKNFQAKTGEIDLIMQEGQVLVFVEVRSRRTITKLHVIETIDSRKRDRIIRTSQLYLQRNRSAIFEYCRFDLVLVTGAEKNRTVEWIKNAFET